MGKSQRDKGARGERDFVNRCKAAGFEAHRIPMSGASRFAAIKGRDVDLQIRGEPWPIELKWRGDGFKFIYSSLGENHALGIKADNQPWLVVVPLDRFLAAVSTGSNT